MFVRLHVATAVHPTGTVKQLDIYTIRYFISIQDCGCQELLENIIRTDLTYFYCIVFFLNIQSIQQTVHGYR